MKHKITKLDRNGDTVVEFDPTNETEVSAGRKLFEEAIAQGYIASEMDASGKKGEIVKSFNPGAQDTLLVAPVYGG